MRNCKSYHQYKLGLVQQFLSSDKNKLWKTSDTYSLSRESFFLLLVTQLFIGIIMKNHLRKEHIKPFLLFLVCTGIAVVVLLLVDVIGLWGFLLFTGQWSLPKFAEYLAILLLLEGSIVGVLGAFIFYGYSEYRLRGQAALWPSLASDQVTKWRERRLSQQELGLAMIVAGVLLILLFILVSLLASI